jgi:hypothetical protein
MTTTDPAVETDTKLRHDARQALANTPQYIVHIGQGLVSTVRQLQTGNNVEGMDTFARSMADLSQFMHLFQQMQRIAQPSSNTASTAFREGIVDCVQQLNDAMMDQDLDALSSGIEGTLLPLLPMWEQVAYELQDGFEPRHA